MAKKRFASNEEVFYGLEPDFTDSDIAPEDYNMTMIMALNYYSAVATKAKRAWWLKWAKSKGMTATSLMGIPNDRIVSIATLARMSSRGFALNKEHESHIAEVTSKLKKQFIKPVITETSDDVRLKELAKEEAVDMLVGDVLNEFDSRIDLQVTDRKQLKSPEVDCSKLNVGQFNYVKELYAVQLSEIREAYNKGDADVVEGYIDYDRPQLRRLLKLFEFIAAELLRQEGLRITAKPFKKRKVKVKTPAVQVKGVKYLAVNKEFGIESIKPEKLIDATAVYIFNTKNRKLHYYFAPSGITVKGSTLGNFDEAKSYAKTIRKPEEFLKGLMKTPKLRSSKMVDAIKAKGSKLTGRVNVHCVILKVY